MKKNVKHLYPYENLSLADMKGEVWHYIKGFDDYYMISNYGRIKSVSRVIEYVRNGRDCAFFKEGRIKKQRPVHVDNPITRHFKGMLTVSLQIAPSESRMYTVARLVYETFINKIEDGMIITHYNKNALDNRKENLEAVTFATHIKRIYDKGWMPHFARINDLISTEARRQANIGKFKPVSQYDMDGKRIAVYDCVMDAARAVDNSASNIRRVTDGRYISAAGFLWRNGVGAELIDTRITKKRLQAYKHSKRIPVTQYDLNGNRLQIFESITEAAKAVNGTQGAIRYGCEGGNKTAYDFMWRKGRGRKKIKGL